MSTKPQPTKKRASASSLRERRVLYTAETLFVQSVASNGDGYGCVDYYAAEALRAARVFWIHADPPRSRTKRARTKKTAT